VTEQCEEAVRTQDHPSGREEKPSVFFWKQSESCFEGCATV